MIYKKLAQLTERQLYLALKKYKYPQLIDLNEFDDKSVLDFFEPVYNFYIEAKCRSEHYDDYLLVEEKKWKEMKKVDQCYYINSTPHGIYAFDITNMEEPVFFPKTMKKSNMFKGKDEYVLKNVAALKYSDASFNLEHLLFKYL